MAIKADPEQIAEALKLLFVPGSVVELRALHTTQGTASGFYDDFERLVADAVRCVDQLGAEGVYVTLNPVKPEILGRSRNRLKTRLKEGMTSDSDIACRRWLPIDIDPVRPSGVSSTDEQHEAAGQLAWEIIAWLSELGFPEPVLADSGNGAHLLYRVDLPNDQASTQLISRCLDALALQFSDKRLQVDQKTFNAARIWKLYGTPARKGDSSREQPHRLAAINLAPEAPETVAADKLATLAALAPKAPPASAASGSGRTFDIDSWLQRYNPPVVSSGPWQGGRKWILNPCPWNADHNNRAAFIVQHASGAIAAACHHNGCAGKSWSDLRRLYEPQYAERVERRIETAKASALPHGVIAGRVKPEPVLWLWRNYLPLAKLCDLQGDPGEGKSLLTTALAATVSIGGKFPDGEPCLQGNVLIISAEDDAADTIRPRLEVAGADLERVFLRTITDDALLTLPDDLAWMYEHIKANGTKLTILDPLDAFLADTLDANKNQSIRRLLAKLAKLASVTRSVLLVVRHLNKDAKTTNPMYRGGGSIGLNAASRQVLLVGHAPEDRTLRVLAPVKANLGPEPPSLGYHIVEAALGDKITTARLDWTGEVKWSARDLLAEPEPKRGPSPEKIDAVATLIREVLADGGEHEATEVEDHVRSNLGKVSHDTIFRGRMQVGVRSRKRDFRGTWVWSLEGSPHEESTLRRVEVDNSQIDSSADEIPF